VLQTNIPYDDTKSCIMRTSVYSRAHQGHPDDFDIRKMQE